MQGYTRELSIDGALIEHNGSLLTGRNALHPGDHGILVLHYQQAAKISKLRLKCNITQVMPSWLKLNLVYSELTKPEQESLKNIIETG